VKYRHFEAIRPVCPVCRGEGESAPLLVDTVVQGTEAELLEGVIRCSRCRREYPVLDGIPMLVPTIRHHVQHNAAAILYRDDLSSVVESILGDCAGPGSEYDILRQHLSNYCSDHWGDLDPQATEPERVSSGAIHRLLERVLPLNPEGLGAGPVLDLGCSVGRSSFELAARTDGLVLGVDLNFSMLRVASRALRTGRIRYPRRRVGVVYDRREFDVDLVGSDRVDFWHCDVTALPFAEASFPQVLSLNLIDCLQDPRGHLVALRQVLRAGGTALLCTPFDWSTAATPMESWVGGHSQRGAEAGDSRAALHALLAQAELGLQIRAETDSIPWQVRIHERSIMHYACLAVFLGAV
jgi:SAM-dependent methyltransferase/uncharacterized protein YbaR (Trm112 family)